MYYIKSRWGYLRNDVRPINPRWTRDRFKAYLALWDDAAATQRIVNQNSDGNTHLEPRASGKQGG